MTAVPAPTPQSNEAAQAALIDAINRSARSSSRGVGGILPA